jgi:shikimate kinase
VGRIIADVLGCVFIDMDEELTAEEGMSIQEIISRRGWEYFRQREIFLIRRLSQTSGQVIATGGGVVTESENIAAMRGSGKVVWLDASPAAIAARMRADSKTGGQRPPLRGQDSIEEIREVVGQRLEQYEQAMHFRVETDKLSPQEVAQRVLAWLRSVEGGVCQ